MVKQNIKRICSILCAVFCVVAFSGAAGAAVPKEPERATTKVVSHVHEDVWEVDFEKLNSTVSAIVPVNSGANPHVWYEGSLQGGSIALCSKWISAEKPGGPARLCIWLTGKKAQNGSLKIYWNGKTGIKPAPLPYKLNCAGGGTGIFFLDIKPVPIFC